MTTRSQQAAMIAICAALYAVVGRLTDFGLTVGGVAFWPAAIIPAVFAVLFGPFTGGVGAAIGIFIRDMLFHGDPWLSLSAGVTSNFIMFFLLGQISRTNLSWKKLVASATIGGVIVVAGILLPTIVLPAESTAFTGLSFSDTMIVFTLAVLVSVAIMIAVAKLWSEWRNYFVGSVIGLGVGAAIIAPVVWAYSQVFYSPTGYFKAPISSTFIMIIFVWTFATEIPFILLLGPPIMKVCYRAYPSLRVVSQKKQSSEG